MSTLTREQIDRLPSFAQRAALYDLVAERDALLASRREWPPEMLEAARAGDVERLRAWGEARHRAWEDLHDEIEQLTQANEILSTATTFAATERNELRARAEKAEAAAAAMREALTAFHAEHGKSVLASAATLAKVEAALATDIGRGWVSPEVARQAIEALELAYGLLDTIDQGPRVENSNTWRIPWSRAAVDGFSRVFAALAALKKAVGDTAAHFVSTSAELDGRCAATITSTAEASAADGRGEPPPRCGRPAKKDGYCLQHHKKKKAVDA